MSSDESPPKKLKRNPPDEVLASAVNSILPQEESTNDISEPQNLSAGSSKESEDESKDYDGTKSNEDGSKDNDDGKVSEDGDDNKHNDDGDDIKDNDKNGSLYSGPATQECSVEDVQEGNNVPKSLSSHSTIIAEHYNSLEEKGLQERDNSRILYMRNFNNWIKSTLLSGFIKKVKAAKKDGEDTNVLDMGCGKGGDLFKWQDGGVTHAIFADLAETSVTQCEKRYEGLKNRPGRHKRIFSAEFIAADCTRVRLRDLYKNPSMQLDLVSCQFAFHYCWESLAQAECMLRNASECLRVGGYFVGTCPNAYTIMSRLRKSGGKEFGNSVYSVKFEHEYPEDETPPLFGAKYNFHLEGVVDCPEFLVHFPTLRLLARKFGFEIVNKMPFASFYKSKLQEENEHYDKLLHKMNALEAYPNDKLVAPIEEYTHAAESINGDGSKVVGTLSKSEWEAISLYLVFAFKKLKPIDPEWSEDIS